MRKSIALGAVAAAALLYGVATTPAPKPAGSTWSGGMVKAPSSPSPSPLVVHAPHAQLVADVAPLATSNYTRTYTVSCFGHTLKVWATFQYDSSGNQRRGIRGGFDAPDATQMYSRLGVVSAGSGSVGSASWSPAVIHGSAYNYGAWSSNSSQVYVQVVPQRYPGRGVSLDGCNGGFGYKIPSVG
jgi:hypothetical protein